jgi:hypothetical protein
MFSSAYVFLGLGTVFFQLQLGDGFPMDFVRAIG